jgi:hypothetical protein
MSIFLRDLIAAIDPSVEQRVRRTRDRSRAAIQEALRSECRLSMRSADELEEPGSTASVRVEIEPGYPEILEHVEFPDDLEHVLLLNGYRTQIEQVVSGLQGLEELREQLLHMPRPDHWVKVSADELAGVRSWGQMLLQVREAKDPLSEVLAVKQDILGVYEYDARCTDEYEVNRAVIRLYWGVIGLFSKWLACSVEDLTIVVLAHELAHAYTQLGSDIEGRRWPSRDFSRADIELVEGLAQYYALQTLNRLSRRFPGALTTFELLLAKQSEPYHAHEPWLEHFTAEAVRRAMIEARRWREGSLEEYEDRLAHAAEQLRPGRQEGYR